MIASNEDYLPYLRGIRRSNDGYMALCPFHSDHHPSFHVSGALWYCFACKEGGNFDQFLNKLGVEMHKENGLDVENTQEEVKITNYEYYDLDGKHVYTKIRKETENQKTFIIKKEKAYKETIFYNIQDLKKHAEEIWITEGEKCTEALKKITPSNVAVIGYINWDTEYKEEYARFFDKKKIVIFEDNDEIGRSNTKKIVNTLKGIVANIRLVEFQDSPIHYDIADFLEANDIDTFDLLYADAEYIYYPIIASTISINGANLLKEKLPEPIIVAEDILDIPRGIVGLIASRGGQGKSMLALYTACQLSLRHTPTTILALEDNINYIKLRLQRLIRKFYLSEAQQINISLARVSISSIMSDSESEWSPAGVIFLKTLETLLKTQRVIFIDPVGGLLGNENSSINAQKIMQKFQFLSEKYEGNIILIHHTRKGDQDGSDVVRGSSALFDNARWVALVNREGKSLNIRVIKNNFHVLRFNRVENLFEI